MDTLHLAEKESQSWFLAQVLPSLIEPAADEQQPTTTVRTDGQAPFKWRCQVDASGTGEKEGCGLGFIALENNKPILYGARGGRAKTPLHAEAKGLIWALQEMVKLGLQVMHFESDCEQIVNTINREEEWPALAMEIDEIKDFARSFMEFSVSFIPRVLNVRADGLAKGARSRALQFPYVDGCAPRWLVNTGHMDAN
ncbi:hypothetical protein F2Q70_00016292 [Brassica cretica]|uniref:RNase H type-1 domain-containing protein n=1 Tax=Brassica cretica TaxID=69181 RepID=A0A8S9HT42_BRACR|nr:hypothetical protein F2Q70_00016292 [Brassica cretica]